MIMALNTLFSSIVCLHSSKTRHMTITKRFIFLKAKQVRADGDRDATAVPPNHKGLSPINSQFLTDTKVGWHQQHSSLSTKGSSSNREGLINVRDSAGETTGSPELSNVNPSFDKEYPPLSRHRTRVDLSPREKIDKSVVLPNEIFPISSPHQLNDIPLPASPSSIERKSSPPYHAGRFQYLSPSTVVLTPRKEIVDNFNSSQDQTSPVRYFTDEHDHVSLPTSFGRQGTPASHVRRRRPGHTRKRNLDSRRGPSLSKNLPAAPFDICQCEEMPELDLFKQDTTDNV